MPKRPKMCPSSSFSYSSFSSHFLFPLIFSGTIADTDIINTPLEPRDVPFGGYKTETKDLGGILATKSIFGCSRAI